VILARRIAANEFGMGEPNASWRQADVHFGTQNKREHTSFMHMRPLPEVIRRKSHASASTIPPAKAAMSTAVACVGWTTHRAR
jgi:hypothetical protein